MTSKQSCTTRAGRKPKTVGRHRVAVLWVDYKIPSLNTEKYKHWRVAWRHAQDAKAAWSTAVASFLAGSPSWLTATISAEVERKLCAMRLRQHWESTTPTATSNGPTNK